MSAIKGDRKNVLVVIAHPNTDSFNHAMVARLTGGLEAAGHEVRIRDLYARGFDPVLGADELAALQEREVCEAVLAEQEQLTWADALVVMYPLWWFERPAILKGWFDRVLTHGYAFAYDESGVKGLLKLEKALVLVTAGGAEADFTAMGMSEDDLVKPVTLGTLAFCGVEQVSHKLFYQVPVVGDDERRAMLDEVEALGTSF
ncbi:MAG: NAD(P)H-dependent oxidoreductase [bacterium]